ncbi:MAG: cyclic nucleotide-binding domain-containing protein [Candidatus Latescibacteria bacterium]|jgi:CRP-like cAMP-binding protein|nr:cyclic nucleotide-binding domain-containing protein [Candidatus Latescibacterota bacterium]
MEQSAPQGVADILSRIPIFRHLTLEECRRILTTCKRSSFPADKTIYATGAPSKEMLILLNGTVSIQTSGGVELTKLHAPDTVGEMEILSAQPRVARVVAEGEVSGLTMTRVDLEELFKVEPQMGIKLLKNIVESLSKKLADSNRKLTDSIS